jgi:hypothetical protein
MKNSEKLQAAIVYSKYASQQWFPNADAVAGAGQAQNTNAGTSARGNLGQIWGGIKGLGQDAMSGVSGSWMRDIGRLGQGANYVQGGINNAKNFFGKLNAQSGEASRAMTGGTRSFLGNLNAQSGAASRAMTEGTKSIYNNLNNQSGAASRAMVDATKTTAPRAVGAGVAGAQQNMSGIEGAGAAGRQALGNLASRAKNYLAGSSIGQSFQQGMNQGGAAPQPASYEFEP